MPIRTISHKRRCVARELIAADRASYRCTAHPSLRLYDAPNTTTLCVGQRFTIPPSRMRRVLRALISANACAIYATAFLISVFALR